MSEESDQVWETLSGELRKVRRRRAALRMGALAAVAMLGVFFVQRAVQPDDEGGRTIVAVPAAVPADDVTKEGSPQLAVLVYDGEGMRFELIDGERLGSSEMEFSLQPVVMGLPRDSW